MTQVSVRGICKRGLGRAAGCLGLGLVGLAAPGSLAWAADSGSTQRRYPTALSLEFGPEYYAESKPGSYDEGDLALYYLKLGLSHSLENDFVLGATIEHKYRVPDESSGSSSYDQAEASLGYRIRLTDPFSLTPSAVIGYGFGEEPKIDPDDPEKSAFYYALKLAADLEITPEFTWNIVEFRYRDAFSYTWKTPKIQTGFTFGVSERGKIGVNAGTSWKNVGDGEGYVPDNFSVGVEYKFSF